MTGNTVNEGFPYPLTTDFADVQDAFRLVTAIDTNLRAEQAPFRAFEGTPSFIGRQTATGSGFTAGSQTLRVQAIDWDNTGGLVLNSASWSQPLAQQPSWWMFGANVLVNNAATPVVADMTMAQLTVTTVDPVTGISSSTNLYQRNDETNTGGEQIIVFTQAAIYQGSVSCTLWLNGTTQKSVALGSRLWGIYLGPVT